MNKFLDRIYWPFRHDLPLLLVLWILLSLPECRLQIAMGNLYFSFLFFIMYFEVSYIILVPLDWAHWTRRILKPLFCVILTFFTAADLYCVSVYHTRLKYDIIEIIGATNPAEVKEFLMMYLDWNDYVLLILFITITGALLYLSQNQSLRRIIRLPSLTMGFLICVSVIAAHYNPILNSIFYTWDFKFEQIADLSKYPTNPVVEEIDSVHPDNIIIIIGESFAKSHSSLYGYEKMTNPKLSLRRDSGDLVTYSDVRSPATHTTEAFKYILNTLIKGKENKKWYKSTHLMEVLNKTGYQTSWISNQLETGLSDNLCSAAAKICDKKKFIRIFFEDSGLDGELIDYDTITPDTKRVVLYHFMGQHSYFSYRYPKKYGIFTPQDYGYSDIEKNDILAQYDNATLYNDFVVDEIINKYAGTDAVVFYFPDHGLDVYESDPTYCGHAKNTPESKEISCQIPFMVYMSPEFQKRHPRAAAHIRQQKDIPLTTDSFIFSALDAAGFRLVSYE